MDLNEHSEDILLFAYVDGELGTEQRRAIEELLTRDPTARRRVEEIRELNRLLKAAYDEDGDKAF